jgi:hypothetical protein
MYRRGWWPVRVGWGADVSYDFLVVLTNKDLFSTHAPPLPDADVADFVYRANHWFEAWSAEVEASGDDLWERGCGW